ncbi:ribonuclease E inhibitor RraB [Vibrio sp. V27_P1S3P104]|uniref:ribonuclease E inhibitor RraB n=1 Tax=unclassified Vibrio TaxID=2614977 RepID=UPI001372BE35|nr:MULTISPECIES: ribonuclease E inhibitor RraB [unclassified Vibrio]NAW70246.1 ribonuclease E inhibitor RraB [Vibrio sp. V28_P6S34P95]NAX03774.1 ribonuclease E inhibitor RraB [Vibrio sp. V30_P3S12P165]NAX33527.1 ribonuclease E inhibitor RraB [Vibrio sp. V29_P1S30P107]NAX38651.1 ribonuclease E inhibitor RraB [Vibrio sp. V27_P1S3P104]NAX41002.1 ribonuclease E inhibitor RraB [Vibrio sp. V26_P1S5P106]
MSHDDDYLSVEAFIEMQKEETREIIQALLDDGSDPEALYEIEHHFFSEDFDKLEKAAVEAFKLGFEVLEAEEAEDEEGNKLLCFDATMSSVLNPQAIDEQVEKLVNLAEKFDVIYDGWGTYYEGDDALYDEEDDDNEE